MDGEQVEHRAKKNNDGYGDDQCAYQPVDEHDAIFLEVGPDLVDEPCQPIPPQNGSCHDAQKSDGHHEGLVGDDECELGEAGHEEQDDQRPSPQEAVEFADDCCHISPPCH